jgi:hypothetical protein
MSGAPEENAECIPRETAIQELAEFLHWEQWRLDPEPGESAPPKWTDLPEFDQNFYRSCVEALLSKRSLITAALSRR